MTRFIQLLLLSIILLGCTADRRVGVRFEMERDLSRANARLETLQVRPELVQVGAWQGLADEYESIADRGLRLVDPSDTAAVAIATQGLSARALLTAAELRARIGDVTDADAVLERAQTTFDHLPSIAAEVAMRRGALAESGGQAAEAAAYYERAVARLAPHIGGERDPAARILDLPLRIARLNDMAERKGDREAPRGARTLERYAWAAAYYDSIMANAGDERLQMEAQAQRATLAADQGEWALAVQLLESLESRLRSSETPYRDPSQVRLLIAEAQRQGGVDHATSDHTLETLLTDYPASGWQAAAMSALARSAALNDDPDRAVALLDSLRKKYDGSDEVCSQALLERARILEHAERWQEARLSYQSLSVEHPLSQAALIAPLEIAGHYARAGDEEAKLAALRRAESDYRTFIEHYSPGQSARFAREQLIQTLLAMEADSAAVTEMQRLGELMGSEPRGAQMLRAAAQTALVQLGDTTRAVEICERLGELHADTEAATWAASQIETIGDRR